MVEAYAERMKEIISDLDHFEETINQIIDEQSKTDMMISDILHYIEENRPTTGGAYRLCRELKKLREKRRGILKLIEFNRTYTSNKNKLVQSDNRKLLLAELNKTMKNYNDSEYRYRELSFEQLNSIDKRIKEA